MTNRAVGRLRDMKGALVEINALLHGRSIQILSSDRVIRAAYERFLEIVSEASRGVPDDWKEAAAPDIAWRRMADIGNHIRHAYDSVDTEVLWNLYEDHLGPLEQAVDDMLVRHAPS